MCRINPSESGHGGGFVPCEEYKLLKQKHDQLLEHREFLFEVVDNLIQDNEVLATRNVNLCQERDRLKLDCDYLYDGLNKILHPNGEGPERPSGCDLLTFLKSDLDKLAKIREAANVLAATAMILTGAFCKDSGDKNTRLVLVEDLKALRSVAKTYKEARNAG